MLPGGDVIYQHSQELRDVNSILPLDGDTIYIAASVFKAFTASTVESFVSEGILYWSTPLEEILPALNSTEIQPMNVIIEDCFAHRTGLSGGETVWFHAEPLLSDAKVTEVSASLPPPLAYPSRMLYNNL